MRWLLAAILVAATFSAFNAWQHRPVTQMPGILAPAEPLQGNVTAHLASFRHQDATLTPRARFSLEARALSVTRYRFGRLTPLVPFDVAFGWGAMSDSAVLAQLDISQSDRFFFWKPRTPSLPIPRADIESHSANMHLIPANDGVTKILSRLREGQVVSIEGLLVDLKFDSGYSVPTSMRRDDTGAGACEVIWVEAIAVRY